MEIFGIDKLEDISRYIRKSYNIYEIRHDFPSFKDINIHPSISGIKYKIDLSMCDEWMVPLMLMNFNDTNQKIIMATEDLSNNTNLELSFSKVISNI